MIPKEAVQAAAAHMHEDEGYFEAWADAPVFRKEHFMEKAAGILEAAAPYIAEAVLNKAADSADRQEFESVTPRALRRRARSYRLNRAD